MSEFIAALPMYDWPERRDEVDAEWAAIRDRLCAAGVPAPEALTRDIDMHEVWLRPNLILAQTCWGPLELGLREHVTVLGQPDYSAFEGGAGELYSSALVMRQGEGAQAASPADGSASLPLEFMRGKRFAFNSDDSMSGVIALTRDLEAAGEGLGIFGERMTSGGHRMSVAMVAKGDADVCAIDCRSWALAQRFEPAAREVAVVGWTARRKGLPYIAAPKMVDRFPALKTLFAYGRSDTG
ncbi:MAG: phosphate/phosphite/phosphonate ABC transporter substrate-binding protein [Hyphomicrobiaceae bacterium]